MGHRLSALIGLCLWGQLSASAAAAEGTCDPQSVFLRNADGKVVRFGVEIADDAQERATGLMNRAALARSMGMLFAYDAPRQVAFWMKNTLIPLDLLFVDAGGLVTRVHAMAKPLDTTLIDGGEGVQFVLEVNGGMAALLGLQPGTVLRHPAIDQSRAIWPCAEK